MNTTVLSIENVSKLYRLGLLGRQTLHDDFERWWARVRGKPDPLLKIGEQDHNNRKGEFIWALRDVSFTVRQGEVMGIIGRNGAGKSTLLKVLSRVTAPTSGQVKVQGRIASLLEVGTGFHPELTGRENIYLNGTILGMRRAEIARKLDEIVAFAEIEEFIDTPVKRYSSGMYVRLAFAVAAHLEPEILLVDEVLAVGDAQFQKKCLGKMGDVAREGRTILFVSHNMAAVQNLCSQVVLLTAGRHSGPMETGEAVQLYMRSASDRRGSWANRPELIESGSVLASAVVTQGGRETDIVRMTAPFQVHFGLSPAALAKKCLIAVHITDAEGAIIYHTMDVYAGSPSNTARVGNRSVQIPAYGLAAGEYHLSYWLGHPAEGVWDEGMDILTWTVQADCPVMTSMPASLWRGVVGPGLARWSHDTSASDPATTENECARDDADVR